MLLADTLQVPRELQGEAASVVSLYDNYRTRNGATLDEVRAAALSLVNQFRVANRRSGARENPSLGHTPSRQASSLPSSGLSEETGQRIARALDAMVAVFAAARGVRNPLEDSDDQE